MTPEQYAQVRALFDAAVALPGGARRAYVEANTPGDSTVRQEVLSLLARHEESSSLPATQADSGSAAFGGSEAPSDSQLGHYKLLRELGGGGMGIVYLAVRNDDVFHKTVAVKIIRTGIVQNSTSSASGGSGRFWPGSIIRTSRASSTAATLVTAGRSTSWSTGRPATRLALPERQRRPRNPPAADAAGLPGRRGTCTTTRSSIAISSRPTSSSPPTAGPRCWILGIAGVQTPEGLVGSPGPAGGKTRLLTPGFASPEQIEGTAASKSSDVYSLGVVLYHLLTGRLPFVNATGEPDLSRQLSDDDPKPPSAAAAERGPATGSRSAPTWTASSSTPCAAIRPAATARCARCARISSGCSMAVR